MYSFINNGKNLHNLFYQNNPFNSGTLFKKCSFLVLFTEII